MVMTSTPINALEIESSFGLSAAVIHFYSNNIISRSALEGAAVVSGLKVVIAWSFTAKTRYIKLIKSDILPGLNLIS